MNVDNTDLKLQAAIRTERWTAHAACGLDSTTQTLILSRYYIKCIMASSTGGHYGFAVAAVGGPVRGSSYGPLKGP